MRTDNKKGREHHAAAQYVVENEKAVQRVRDGQCMRFYLTLR